MLFCNQKNISLRASTKVVLTFARLSLVLLITKERIFSSYGDIIILYYFLRGEICHCTSVITFFL